MSQNTEEMIQRNKKRMIPNVKRRGYSNPSHKFIHSFFLSFLRLRAHLLIQQMSTDFYIVPGSKYEDGYKQDWVPALGEGGDGVDQWSRLTLGGRHTHDLA